MLISHSWRDHIHLQALNTALEQKNTSTKREAKDRVRNKNASRLRQDQMNVHLKHCNIEQMNAM
jgi:hypothetical protein